MFTPKRSQRENNEEYYVVPTIPYEDYPEHNPSSFCGDMAHECHENLDLIDELEHARQSGEVSDTDVQRIYRGKTVY